MIRRFHEQNHREKLGAQGGNGTTLFQDLFSPDELGDRAQMLSCITLMPGVSVGEHTHTENGEVYYVLQGSVTVTEDGKEYRLTAGDAEFCADGHTHGMENRGASPAVVLACIVPNR